jgi:hypothetical protein
MASDRTPLRIDLTDYREYIQALQDRLNADGAYRMSMTDAVKVPVLIRAAMYRPLIH